MVSGLGLVGQEGQLVDANTVLVGLAACGRKFGHGIAANGDAVPALKLARHNLAAHGLGDGAGSDGEAGNGSGNTDAAAEVVHSACAVCSHPVLRDSACVDEVLSDVHAGSGRGTKAAGRCIAFVYVDAQKGKTLVETITTI